MHKLFFLISSLICLNAFSQNAEIPTVNKSQLVGRWKSGKVEYIFEENGNSTRVVNGRNCPGSWILETNKLTINPKKYKWKKDDPCGKTTVLEVVSVKGNTLTIKDNGVSQRLRLAKPESKPRI